jgi:hypothetical protein
MRVYVVRKWPLPGEKSFLCVGISHEEVCGYRATYILCKVKDLVFVPPLSRDLADLKARIIAALNNIDAPMLTGVWQLQYRNAVCRVTRGAHRCVPCHPWCTSTCAVSPVVHIHVCRVTRGAHRCVPFHPWCTSMCAVSPVVHIDMCRVTRGAHIEHI